MRPADEQEADDDDDRDHRGGGKEQQKRLEAGARRDALEPGRKDATGTGGDGRDALRYVPPQRRAEHARAAFEQPRGEEGVAAGGDLIEELAGLEDDDGGLPGKRGERLELGVELVVDLLRRRRERRRGLALRRRRGDRLHLRVEVGDPRIDARLEAAGSGSYRLHAVALFLEIGERQPVAAERRLGLGQRRPPAVDHLLVAGVVLGGGEGRREQEDDGEADDTGEETPRVRRLGPAALGCDRVHRSRLASGIASLPYSIDGPKAGDRRGAMDAIVSGSFGKPSARPRRYDLYLREGATGGLVWRYRDEGVVLTPLGLEWTASGIKRTAVFAHIRSIRIQTGNVPKSGYFGTCTITFRNGQTLTVNSLNSWGSPDEDRLDDYAEFLQDLHARLSEDDRKRISFIAGMTEGRQMFGKFAVGIGGVFFVAPAARAPVVHRRGQGAVHHARRRRLHLPDVPHDDEERAAELQPRPPRRRPFSPYLRRASAGGAAQPS